MHICNLAFLLLLLLFFFFDICRSLDEIEAAFARCGIQEPASKSKGLCLCALMNTMVQRAMHVQLSPKRYWKNWSRIIRETTLTATILSARICLFRCLSEFEFQIAKIQCFNIHKRFGHSCVVVVSVLLRAIRKLLWPVHRNSSDRCLPTHPSLYSLAKRSCKLSQVWKCELAREKQQKQL